MTITQKEISQTHNSFRVTHDLYIDSCIKLFLNKKFEPKKIVQTVHKKDVYLKLPFLGRSSFNITTKLRHIFSDKLPHYLKVVFISSCRVQNFFQFKDELPKLLSAGIVYKFQCGGCSAIYYGKMKRHLQLHISEHFQISHLTGKNLKISHQSSFWNIQCFVITLHFFENFTTLASKTNDFKLTLMES